MSMRKLKARATVWRHRVCVHSFSECIHAKAVQAACHISVVLQVESECVSFEFVYACVLVSACLHKSA